MLIVSVVIEGPLWQPEAAQVPKLAGEPDRPAGAPGEEVSASNEATKVKMIVRNKIVVFFVITYIESELKGVKITNGSLSTFA